jgi:hypothetical protein
MIVRSTISLAHSVDLHIVAEGVEAVALRRARPWARPFEGPASATADELVGVDRGGGTR